MRYSAVIFVLILALAGCGKQPSEATQEAGASNREADVVPATVDERLQIAERMIDAFYSFESQRLRPFLVDAAGSAAEITFYQGWAEGGNYKVLNRAPCVAQASGKISCSITVEDDAVLALKTDFKVTDTFTLSFDGSAIIRIETSSNDQPIYYQAQGWVKQNMPEVMEGPCRGFFKDGPTPGDCARAMAEGYRRFAESNEFPD